MVFYMNRNACFLLNGVCGTFHYGDEWLSHLHYISSTMDTGLCALAGGTIITKGCTCLTFLQFGELRAGAAGGSFVFCVRAKRSFPM